MDKLWFFLSDDYFGNFDKSSQQSIGWLTVPPGERRIGTNNIFGKITFTPYKDHTLSLSGTLDKFLHQTGGIGVPETYTKTTYTRYSYRLNYRAILSQSTFLTAAWGQNRNDTDLQPLSGDFGPRPIFGRTSSKRQTTPNKATGRSSGGRTWRSG